MQHAPLPVAVPSPSSSKPPAMKADETNIELPTRKVTDTWHSEIFELSFMIKNPENAMTYFLYSSEAVAGRDNPKIRVSMKLTQTKYGFYVHVDKVSRM
jgi:hypothetical protein